MTNPAVIDGPLLLDWARRSAEALDEHREAINALNVFPVPDSDTGSNMAHTMAAAVREAAGLDPTSGADQVAEALAYGSVKGARGNSGIVLSQVLRGVAHAALDGELDGGSVASALLNAVGFVERAINAPVEGTIVTVLREAANAARDASETGDVAEVSAAALDAAEKALDQTPSQLAELREAGVVDAGGTGLVLLLSVLHECLTGEGGAAVSGGTAAEKDSPHGTTGWLEVLFMFAGPLDELETELSKMGRSLVVARVSDTSGKVHIHSTTEDAGAVIETAYGLGTVTDLRLEILPDASPLHEARRVGRLIVAVTPPGSLSDLYTQAGAVTVAPGPTIIEDVRREVEASGAHEIIVLPNGQLDEAMLADVRGAAEEASISIVLLPTVRLVNGIAALAVHDSRQPLERAAALMNEAVEDMLVADIRAGGDGVEVLARDETVAADADFAGAVRAACATLLAQEDGEMVTLLLPPERVELIDVHELQRALGAEVLVYPADGLDNLGQIGVE